MKILSIFLLVFIISFTEEKKLKVELSVQEWNLIYECLDNSTASHDKVKKAFDLLNKQIVPQVDTTKKK